ncbi:MAG: hypothetical protein IPL78_29005 [Chloroflexi bacterium]|nr:hypothetical protein [Chloroflexota bacterium]
MGQKRLNLRLDCLGFGFDPQESQQEVIGVANIFEPQLELGSTDPGWYCRIRLQARFDLLPYLRAAGSAFRLIQVWY